MLMTEWNTEVAIRVSREEGREEGLEEGVQKGREEERRIMAMKMLRRGTPLEYVIEDTGLSIAEIQFLQLQLS
jgi:predicted transposase/invertase (TIGR01784 family)